MSEEKKMVTIRAAGQTREFVKGSSCREIAEAFQELYPNRILLARRNGKYLMELWKKVNEDCELEFLTMKDKAGFDVYRRSVCFLMLKAVSNLCAGEDAHVWIRFAVSDGLFCTMRREITQEFLDNLKKEMVRLRDGAYPILKQGMNTDSAIELFSRTDMLDKAKLFRYRINARTNVYTLDGYKDYYYGDMVPDTSYLDLFDLKLFEDGFVLQLPTREKPDEIPPFDPVVKLFHVQNHSRLWGELMDVDTVGDLNDLIAAGKTKELILAQEALHERQMARIAEQIAKNRERRVVLIAGPSSSGKTTFSHRLSTQLSIHGLKPHPIPMDDFFKNREDTPKNEDGSYDFECLEAIDSGLFSSCMAELLEGRDVQLPTFNFITGKREYKGRHLQLKPEEILVIEGIHGINDALTYSLPAESKFKIYISALTQLNIDEHNRIPTTDGRLLRRIIRDQRTRGNSARNTIAMWPSVRRGEENYIFPFQESADVMFNSALIYELAVLRSYAQPVLFAVPRDCPEWEEAYRLLKFLDYFLPVQADHIPVNSLIREFIGGSIYEV